MDALPMRRASSASATQPILNVARNVTSNRMVSPIYRYIMEMKIHTADGRGENIMKWAERRILHLILTTQCPI